MMYMFLENKLKKVNLINLKPFLFRKISSRKGEKLSEWFIN